MKTDLPNPRIFIPAVALMALIIASLAAGLARGEDVNLAIIATIESSNNPLAYNANSGACGMYQFTPIAWQDVQTNFPELRQYPFKCAYKPQVAILFAKAYFALIDRYLTHFGLKKTIANRLACYNQGIGKTKRGILTKESREYIRRYILLDKKYKAIMAEGIK